MQPNSAVLGSHLFAPQHMPSLPGSRAFAHTVPSAQHILPCPSPPQTVQPASRWTGLTQPLPELLLCAHTVYTAQTLRLRSQACVKNQPPLGLFPFTDETTEAQRVERFVQSAKCLIVVERVSHSVVSNSLQTPGLYSPPGSSVHGILQAEYWSG